VFTKSKISTNYTIEMLAKDIDDLIVKAQTAFVDSHRIVDLMESRIAAIRVRQAASFSHAPVFVSGNL
jgi:hypothetical protein